MLHRDRTKPEVRELLDTPPLAVLSRVDVPVPVDRNTTQLAEVARVSPKDEAQGWLARTEAVKVLATEPLPSAAPAITASLTKVPSVSKTWIRLFPRSHT